MPLEKVSCDDCGKNGYRCPGCGSHMVTPLENMRKPSPTKIVTEGPGGEHEFIHVCWDCGWDEKVYVDVMFESEGAKLLRKAEEESQEPPDWDMEELEEELKALEREIEDDE